MAKLMNLGLIVENNKVLLGMKKRGYGADRWNGFGGKLHENETIEEALVREFKEEAGVTPTVYEKRGIITFHNDRDDAANNKDTEVHIFKITKYDGAAIESEEMRPGWFDKDKLPFEAMWPADAYWMPLFLDDKKFTGEFWFEDNTVIIRHKLREVSEL